MFAYFNFLNRKYQKQPLEVSVKKVFLKISKNSQENTCSRISFLIKLQTEAGNFIKKDSGTGAFL